jgi:hypothetical protein
MIRHFVLLHFENDVTDDVKTSLFRGLEGLRDIIPGILDFHSHMNISVEADLIHGFKDAFWFDFADASVRGAYLAHPAHRAVGEKIGSRTVNGGEGVVVFDMEI